MPNSGSLDQALVAYLAADATLAGLLPDGVFVDEAPPYATRFVLVSLSEAHDASVFGQRGIESALYLVKAVAISGVLANLFEAEARIDALLDGGALTVPGYAFMAMYREQRARHAERDAIDPSIRWFHRGGLYRIELSVPELTV